MSRLKIERYKIKRIRWKDEFRMDVLEILILMLNERLRLDSADQSPIGINQICTRTSRR